MKLDRNITNPRRGKYALVKLRVVANHSAAPRGMVANALHDLAAKGCLDYGDTPETDFFVIRLKDKYAFPALNAYAMAASDDDPEYSKEVEEMALTALNYPGKRVPD